ncbi:MAG TPA: septal ring lytic transglycosylase RlpA family protein [Bacteroidota bacterium]|nr:septal ring lytic transglycosylase RlpA family protein [Bacteroidota bacterium]
MKDSTRRNTNAFIAYSGFIVCVAVALLLIAGCASSPRFTKERSAEPRLREGSSPAKSLKTMEGIASYYAEDFNGKKTANGEVYDMYKMTAAHRSLPFNTKVKVTNLDNKRSIIVRINDRGPFRLDRIIDLSLAAATQLGMKDTGTAKVKLEVVEWGDEEYSK